MKRRHVRTAIAMLSLLVVAWGQCAEAAAPAIPGATTVDDAIARLNALTQRRDYTAPDGTIAVSMRYVTSVDRRANAIIVTRWIESFGGGGSRWADEARIPVAPVTAHRFPVRGQNYGRWTVEVHKVGYICPKPTSCIEVSTGQASRRYEGAGYECDAARCEQIHAAVEQLLVALKSVAPPSAPLPAPPPAIVTVPTPLQRATRDTTRRITTSIARAAWVAPGGRASVTLDVSVTPEGRIAVSARQCPPGAERDKQALDQCREASSGEDTVVQFAPADIDGSSIAVQSAGDRHLVGFACRDRACIASPDGRLQFRGYGLACTDLTRCNRLVTSFSSLLDLVAAQAE